MSNHMQICVRYTSDNYCYYYYYLSISTLRHHQDHYQDNLSGLKKAIINPEASDDEAQHLEHAQHLTSVPSRKRSSSTTSSLILRWASQIRTVPSSPDLCVCVCVCARENASQTNRASERESARECERGGGERESEREKEREKRERACVCVRARA